MKKTLSLLIFLIFTGVSLNAGNIQQGSLGSNPSIKFSDGPNLDAFGKLRVSNPETVFESKNIYDDPDLASNVENQPLIYDNQETAGSGTSTSYVANEAAQYMTVGNLTEGTRIRQSKARANYQPGKSLQLTNSFIMGSSATGITQREGFFDANNGIFLEQTSSGYFIVMRSNASGSPVDTRITQANWNIDSLDGNGRKDKEPGGCPVAVDFTKASLLVADIEWLGVGRVRVGVNINGKIYYAHEFLNTNNLSTVYMSTPNLPVRSEISNDGTGPAKSLIQICSTIISEGGQNALGADRSFNTGGTAVTAVTENVACPVVAWRLKNNYLSEKVFLTEAPIQVQTANSKLIWELYLNPTVGGTTLGYNGIPQCGIEYAIATSNIMSGGYLVKSGFIESGGQQNGNAGSGIADISSALTLGSTIAGVSDVFVLAVKPVAGSTSVAVEACVNFNELY